MKASFYLSDLGPQHVPETVLEEATLDSLKQHLKARRIRNGEEVILLNGQGLKAIVVCTQDSPKHAFKIKALDAVQKETPDIHLFVAAPKGPAFAELISQATEMGACSITLLESEHSFYRANDMNKLVERAMRISIAAVEQSCLAWAPKITSSCLTDSLLTKHKAQLIVCDEIFAEHTESRGLKIPSDCVKNIFESTDSFSLLIGPEGGWSVGERQIFDRLSAHRLGLGRSVLRVPTAAVAGMQYIYTRHSKK